MGSYYGQYLLRSFWFTVWTCHYTQQKAPGKDQMPTKNVAQVVCITASSPRKRRGEAYVHAKLWRNQQQRCRTTWSYKILTATENGNNETPKTVQDFIYEHAKDSNYLQASATLRIPRSSFKYNRNGFLGCNAPIERELQKVILRWLQASLLYHLQYLRLVGHQSERSVYDSMRREFYWPHIVNGVYTTLRELQECIKNPADKRQRIVQLSLPSGSLKFVVIDILERLAEMWSGQWALNDNDRSLVKVRESQIDVQDDGVAHLVPAYGRIDHFKWSPYACVEWLRRAIC